MNNDEATVLGNVNTAGGSVTVTSNGQLTQDAGTGIVMTVGGQLNVTTLAGDAVLTNTAQNNILTLGNVNAFNDFQFSDSNSYAVTGAIAASGFVELGAASGTVNQSAGSVISNGLLLSGPATFQMDQTANDVATLAADTVTALRYVSDNDFTVGTVDATAGISTTGDVRLDARNGADITFDDDVTSATGSIVATAAAGGSLVQNGGVLDSDANIYLSGDVVGTSANPMLIAGDVELSAQSNTGGVFISNSGLADIDIVAFNPAGFLDPTANAGNIAGISSATQTILRNTSLGTVNLVGTGVINAGTTVTVENNGALTQDNVSTRITGTQLTLEGSGNVGTLANRIIANVPTVIFNKPTVGNVFLTNANGVGVEGTLNGDLLFQTSAGSITINAAGLSGSGASNDFELIGAVQIINGGGVIDMSGGNLGLFSGQVGAGVDIETRNVGTLEGQATVGSFNVNNAYTVAFDADQSGNILTLGDMTNPSLSAFAGIQAFGVLTIDQAADNSIVVANTSAANDILGGSQVNLVVAPSGTGPDQLTVNAGAVILYVPGRRWSSIYLSPLQRNRVPPPSCRSGFVHSHQGEITSPC
ncbi:MAG: hypothetical protein HC901_03085 [Bdellovibrionaceae bacterium]|nr:hypothetical protein [Pseudobdellovibrionaceae bacterium]